MKKILFFVLTLIWSSIIFGQPTPGGDPSGNNPPVGGYDSCYLSSNFNCYTLSAQDSIKTIKIYPNPVENTLMLVNPDRIKFDEISIINLTGQKLNFDLRSTKFDVSTLPSGFYLFKLIFENKELTYKIIKE